jgi:RHS repeat-associated protein
MKTKILNWLVLPGVLLASLALPQAALAGGACTCARFHDWKDLGCRMSPGRAGGPPSGASNAGGNQVSCPDCPSPSGIPRWRVDEPYINLWVTDEPLSYVMSSGQRMVFRWQYKQRYQLPRQDECANLYNVAGYTSTPRYLQDLYLFYQRAYGMTNAGWGHNWLMDVVFWDEPWEAVEDADWRAYQIHNPNAVFSQEYEALMFRPEGAIYYFNGAVGNTYGNTDPLRQNSLQPRAGNHPQATNAPSHDGNNIYWGDPGVGFVMNYPDGSQDVFGLSVYDMGSAPGGYNVNSTAHAFLTQRIDSNGRLAKLGYEQATADGLAVYRLKYVVDPDSHTNTFLYVTGGPHPFQVAEIDDPYGRRATFGYDGSGRLGSITDAATNTSSFGYAGASGWMTDLTTPYGTTSFASYQTTDDTSAPDLFSVRATYVAEPQGAQQFFCYIHHTNILQSSMNPPTDVPGQSFDDGNSGGNHPGLDYRNTFHWDRRQFPALSWGVQYYLTNYARSLAGAVSALTAADLKKGSLKHWLWQQDGVSISESLSSEREPSPDAQGQIEASRTWYNYAHKLSMDTEGGPQVTCIARSLPDGTSQYAIYDYLTYDYPPYFNPPMSGLVQLSRSSYSKPAASVGELTNWFAYAYNYIDLLSVNNSAGQSVNLAYNGNHQVTFITNALNQVTSLSWNSTTHNLTGIALPSGLSASLSYYASNATSPNSKFVSSIAWTPAGRSLAFTYTNSRPRVVHATGTGLPDLWFTNSWDGLNRRTATEFQDGTTVLNVYDRLDLGAAKDRLGYWTYFGHDAFQHLTSISDARSNATQFAWCDCGALNSITDPLTNSTVFNYNNQGLLTNIQFADTSSVTYTLDSIGRVTGAADGLGKALSFGYNNQGLVTVVSNAYGALESAVYDIANRPIQVTDANNVTVTNQFDLLNRLTARIWQDGIGETFGWSTNGLIAYTNRNQKVTRFARDAARRLTAVTNANLEVASVAYNALNQVTDLWDGRANHTVWHYNQYGWLSNKVDALSHEVLRYTHDPNGQIINRWTPQFGTNGYAYDEVGNLKTIIYPSSSISYAYDPLNRLKTMVDDSGMTTFGYTTAGQLQTAAGPWSNDTVTYGYTEGLRTSLTLQQSINPPIQQSLVWDAAWRLYTLASPAGTFNYGYDAQRSTLPTTLTLPNSAWITNHYDSLARLDYTALANRWGHVLDGYGYGYDLLGLRTNITRDFGLTTSTVSVGYDQIGQIVSWTAKEASGTPRLNEQLGFGFDQAGNLRSRTNGGLIQTFTCDPVNELTNITRNSTMTVSGNTPAPATNVTVNGVSAQIYGDFTFAATNQNLINGTNPFTIVAKNAYGVAVTNTTISYLPSSISLSFDLNGNLTSDGTRSFAYDAENRLTTNWVTGAWKSEYVYDGLGRRRIARDYTNSSGTWNPLSETHYIYDGYQLIQERDGSNNVLVTYTRGLDLSGSLGGAGGIGGVLARTDTNGPAFYHADAAGNITGLIDAQGNMAARYMHSAFGSMSGKWGSLADPNTIRFSSKPWHRQSDTYDFGDRDYLASLQRWTSPDPLDVFFDTNPYRFNYNNPLSYVDPDGLGPQMTGFTYNPTSGAVSPQYVDQHFGQDYGVGLNGPLNPRWDRYTEWADENNARFHQSHPGLADFLDNLLEYGPYGMGAMGELGELGNLGKAKSFGKVKGPCPPKFPKLGWKGTKPYKDALKRLQQGGQKVDLGFIPTREQALQLLEDAGVDMKSKELRVQEPHLAPNPHNYPHINYPTPAGSKGTLQIQ